MILWNSFKASGWPLAAILVMFQITAWPNSFKDKVFANAAECMRRVCTNQALSQELRDLLEQVGPDRVVEVLGRQFLLWLRQPGHHVAGELAIVTDRLSRAVPGQPHAREHPALMNYEGYFGFIGHNCRLEFRNIRLLKLTQFGQGEKILEQEKELRK